MINTAKRPRRSSAIRAASAFVAATAMLAATTAASHAGSHHHRKHHNWRNAQASMNTGHIFSGKASYYGSESGSRTASGQRFNQNAMTAAHRTLPFGTRVRVTNLNNERSVVLRINDRGPFVRGRVIDVSRAAAVRLDMLRTGVVPVRVETLD